MTLDELIQQLQDARDEGTGKLPVVADLGELQHYEVNDVEGPFSLHQGYEALFLSVNLNSVG